ncbi:MAG: adenylate/guanylate cyclase domain-containing protein [Chloroflexi bacterium]|nr:MAG: adenylate/guanylate cyclase domain-containing protein [Chloroflexota bacterium]
MRTVPTSRLTGRRAPRCRPRCRARVSSWRSGSSQACPARSAFGRTRPRPPVRSVPIRAGTIPACHGCSEKTSALRNTRAICEMDIQAGDVYEIPPGHDGWVVGDVPWEAVEFASARVFGATEDETGVRSLGTILMTDIVGSTATLERVGDARWHSLLLAHNERLRAQIERFGGREIRTTGDGFQVLFTGAARGVRCAAAMIDSLSDVEIQIRAGLHTGEVELAAGNLHGIAVHAAARVSALAGPSEVLVSAVTRDLLDGSGLMFEERGVHELKGLSGARPVFALVRVSSPAR